MGTAVTITRSQQIRLKNTNKYLIYIIEQYMITR